MSETTEKRKQPTEASVVTVVDSLGRQIKARRLDAMSNLDLFEAVGGANADNRRYMAMAMLCATVTEIDGVPVVFPRTREQVRSSVKRVGDEGMDAVLAAFAPPEDTNAAGAIEAEAAVEQEGLDNAKN